MMEKIKIDAKITIAWHRFFENAQFVISIFILFQKLDFDLRFEVSITMQLNLVWSLTLGIDAKKKESEMRSTDLRKCVVCKDSDNGVFNFPEKTIQNEFLPYNLKSG